MTPKITIEIVRNRNGHCCFVTTLNIVLETYAFVYGITKFTGYDDSQPDVQWDEPRTKIESKEHPPANIVVGIPKSNLSYSHRDDDTVYLEVQDTKYVFRLDPTSIRFIKREDGTYDETLINPTYSLNDCLHDLQATKSKGL